MPSTLTVLGVRREKVTTSTSAGSRRLYINSPLLLLFPVFCVFKFLANQNRMNLTIICTIYSYHIGILDLVILMFLLFFLYFPKKSILGSQEFEKSLIRLVSLHPGNLAIFRIII